MFIIYFRFLSFSIKCIVFSKGDVLITWLLYDTGMKRGKVPPLVIENSQAVKEESVSQESDGGNTQQQQTNTTTTATRVTLPSHLGNEVPRSKLDRITTASSTPDPNATITANLMSKFEHVATDTLLESGRSLLSDKLSSTVSNDSQLSQARLRRRDSRRGKLTISQLLTDQVIQLVM